MSKVHSEEGWGLSRRAALAAAAGMAALAVAPVGVARAAAGRPPRTVLFDDGWRFWRGDVAGGERLEFDASAWRPIHLPHDWSIEDLPGAPKTTDPWIPPRANWATEPLKRKNPFQPTYPEALPEGPPLRVGPFDALASAGGWGAGWTVGGVGWYRKVFAAPDLRGGKRAEICFDGVFSEAEVWLNGVKLGTNVYGYGAFAFDMTPHLLAGRPNVLSVRVSNEGETSRWYSGSGINRHVWLTVTGPVRFAPWGVAVSTPTVSRAAAEIVIDIEVQNHLAESALVEIAAELRDPIGRKVGVGRTSVSLPALGKGVSRVAMSLSNPRLWGPDKPDLYTAEVSLVAGGHVTDSSSTRFGIRSVAVSANDGLTINGQSVKLKGACIHADHGIIGAVAIDRAERRKAELLKRNGYNAVRLGHHMFPQAFLDACDELGLLVVDEVFDVWEKPKGRTNDYSRHFSQHWRADLERMIRQDRNHPSIIFWSIGNEIEERVTPRGAEIAAELREAILALDRSRPLTAGINGPTGEKGEPARRSVDVVGYNYQLRFYDKEHERYPDMIIMSTEQYARDIHDGWRKAEANSWLLGEFVWTGMDYLGEVGAGSSELKPVPPPIDYGSIFLWDYPAYTSGCGEIDILGRRKPQGLYRDVLWGRSPLELLVQRPTPPGTYERESSWGWPDELESWNWSEAGNESMTIRAYTSGDEVRLLLNGREIGRKAVAIPADKLTATFEVPYSPGELTAVAYRDGREIGRKRLETVGTPARVRLRAERSAIAASPNDLAYVFAEVCDAQGRKVPDAQIPLTFSLEGAGTLKATGSANPRGLKSFTDPRSLTFHGEALAIIQPGYRRGRAIVRVASPDLRGDAVRLRIG
jgi:beta-galactosidase